MGFWSRLFGKPIPVRQPTTVSSTKSVPIAEARVKAAKIVADSKKHKPAKQARPSRSSSTYRNRDRDSIVDDYDYGSYDYSDRSYSSSSSSSSSDFGGDFGGCD